MPLVGPSMANRSWGRDQTKCSPKDPSWGKTKMVSPLPGQGLPGNPLGARPGGGTRRPEYGGRTFAHGIPLGSAIIDKVGPPTCGLTTCRRGQRGRVPRVWVAAKDRDLSGPILGCRRGEGMWNVTSRMRKEPELEVEKFRYSWPYLDLFQDFNGHLLKQVKSSQAVLQPICKWVALSCAFPRLAKQFLTNAPAVVKDFCNEMWNVKQHVKKFKNFTEATALGPPKIIGLNGEVVHGHN